MGRVSTLNLVLQFVRKRVFHIDNEDVNCTPTLLIGYLLANDIAYTLFHVIQASLGYEEVERENATAFRVCVRADDEQKVFGLRVFLYESGSL